MNAAGLLAAVFPGTADISPFPAILHALHSAMNRETLRDLTIFALLLAFGVLGRWAQPAWNFTPLAAVTALGAFYFRSWLPAVLLPVTSRSPIELSPLKPSVAPPGIFRL